MYEIGRVVIKTAGRDAGKRAVIIDILDDKYVFIDGQTRRRKCNILHLEPLQQIINIKEKASHDEVKTAFKELGLEARDSKPKPKQVRPKKLRGKEKVKVEKIEQKKGLFAKIKKAKVVEAEVKESKEKKKETALEELAGFEEKKTDVGKSKKPAVKSSEKKPTTKKKKTVVNPF